MPRRALIAAALFALATAPASGEQRGDRDDKAQENLRPKFTLRAQPPVGTTPQRVVFTAELVGGADDFEEYYCPSIEWDWGDETKSESTVDCQPYEAGKSLIKRRFTVEHVFRRPGGYKVFIRLKRRDKAVANASVTVQLRSGGLSDFRN
ncbi:MAG: hypothetical protein A3H97_16350 [Acidobacteria bacterium RIFCSPLOWO2_02_FULL_65_29]|nr:MAG: hypothetical protein A3H97_16350 [Acidobacteria bacterium RIFCSPLOWO2_02_FULL_65_29]